MELEEGVPDYMFPHLRQWLESTGFIEWHGLEYPPDFSDLGRELLLSLKMPCGDVDDFWEQLLSDRELFLDVLDYALAVWSIEPFTSAEVDGAALERILLKGRSAWMVAPKQNELTRRLSEETQKALRNAMSSGTASASHLADAWRDAFGRNPNATSSYHCGVMAIESAIRPIVSPTDPKATLGRMLRVIGDKPSKWKTRFDGDHSAGIVAMQRILRTIWEAHVRHGSDEYESVTLDQARDVCQVALLVVSLVDSQGFVRTEIQPNN